MLLLRRSFISLIIFFSLINSGCKKLEIRGIEIDESNANSTVLPTIVFRSTGGKSSLASGLWHSCAIINGGVQCWGFNGNGRLGNNSTIDSVTPVQVTGLTTGVTAISLGAYHSCAIKNGGVWCWGWNRAGQLGDNSLVESSVPVQVKGIGGVGYLTNVTAIAAANDHTCAIVNGGVQCWGFNGAMGCLGNNSTITSLTPVKVLGLGGAGFLTNVTAIAADGYNSCAIVNTVVQCWGYNGQGQLGDGTLANSKFPVNTGLNGVKEISAGYSHFCAFKNSNVYCWGSNSSGELGDNTFVDKSIPTQVVGIGAAGFLSDVQAIEVGETHSCAMRNGGIVCWGYNPSGGLGNNTVINSEFPVEVKDMAGTSTLSGVQTLSAGMGHTCAIVNGSILCWGNNAEGELGNGDLLLADSHLPVQTSGLSKGIFAVAGGDNHQCAIIDGGVQCWGYNISGQLGDNSTTSSSIPVKVKGVGGIGYLSGVQAISAGFYHTCAITNGAVVCWGNNTNGELGNSTFVSSLVPVQVTGLTSGVQSIASGDSHNCAIHAGDLKCWGHNDRGQLGDATWTNRSTAITVASQSGLMLVSAGYRHTCSVNAAGAAYCWGWNNQGEIGDGTLVDKQVPTAVTGLTNGIQSISVGSHKSHAIVNGSMKSWGDNWYGQLGDGTSANRRTTPVDVVDNMSSVITGFSSISSGYNHTCALINGGMKCWGENDSGQIGDGTLVNKSYPTDVLTQTSNVQMIRAGNDSSCSFIGSTLSCWGSNTFGQLGNSSTIDSSIAVTVADWL